MAGRLSRGDYFDLRHYDFSHRGERLVCRHKESREILFQCPIPLNLREALLFGYSLGYQDGERSNLEWMVHLETLVAHMEGEPIEHIEPSEDEYIKAAAERDARLRVQDKEERDAIKRMELELSREGPPEPSYSEDLSEWQETLEEPK